MKRNRTAAAQVAASTHDAERLRLTSTIPPLGLLQADDNPPTNRATRRAARCGTRR